MTKPLPKNLQVRLAMLFREFKYESFDFNQAQAVLMIDKTYLGRIMSSLWRCGWIDKFTNPEDNRLKTYKIKNIDDSYLQMDTETKKSSIF